MNYILHNPEGRTNHAGRPPKLNAEIEAAIARYRFLFHEKSARDTAAWVKHEYKVDVCSSTVQRHLKSLGFRMGDFKRYPRDRSSDNALAERYEFAMKMPNKYGPETLFHAIYADEMSLVEVSPHRIYSIKGWYPSCDDYVKIQGAHITLNLVLSPSIGVVYFETTEAGVNAESVLSVYKLGLKQLLNKNLLVRIDPTIQLGSLSSLDRR